MNTNWLRDATILAAKMPFQTAPILDQRGVIVRVVGKDPQSEHAAYLVHEEWVGWIDLAGARFNPILPAIETANSYVRRALAAETTS